MNRRDFLKTSAAVGGGAAASTLLPGCRNEAQNMGSDDIALHTETILYPAETCDMMAYWARPVTGKDLPGVVVIHENRGLNPHIEDVTRRMAREGFLVIAPDALSPLGGTPADSDEARGKFRELDREATVKNFTAAVQYLKTHPLTNGKVGCTGFCWGGAMTNQVAVHSEDLLAAAPYYGRQPAAEDVPRIKAAMMLHYASLDERINAGIPEFEEALKAVGISYELFMYEGAGHAFNNDTGSRYHKEAADLAWGRTIAFFKEKLKT